MSVSKSVSVKVNLEQLWEAVENLVEEVERLKTEIDVVVADNRVEVGEVADQTDVEARLDTIEQMLWGEDIAK